MMVGFYGASLVAGDVLSRAANWEERFDNMRRFSLFVVLHICSFLTLLRQLTG